MRSSLGLRLAISYLLVVILGMAVAVALAWQAIERQYIDNQQATLLAQARLVAETLQSAPPTTTQTEPYLQIQNTLPGIHTRLINDQGAVVIGLDNPTDSAQQIVAPLPQLAQNAANAVTPTELLSRPEIQRAIAGQPATAVRRLDMPGGQRVVYAAAPVYDAAGRLTSLVYIASPLPIFSLTALPPALQWQLLGIAVLAAAAAAAAGMLFARQITKPVGQLIQAARAVSAGDLDQAVPEFNRITELGTLGRSFNTMTSNLRQVDQAKAAFLADVSHELRTPLTVIKGTIETLQDGALDDPDARDRFLQSMDREAERLIRLVNDLLVLTRADAGALRLQLQPLDLGQLARMRCSTLEGLAATRGIKLEVALLPPSGIFPVQADPDRLAQVIDNLLDNAIRHSPEGGLVSVTIQRQGAQVQCAIADRGPGIPAQHLPFIFERFYRVDSSRSRNLGGSGLGLSIARALVQAHTGHITVQSIETQGTTFTFWLPGAEN